MTRGTGSGSKKRVTLEVLAGHPGLERLAGYHAYPDFVTAEPELMVRASTAPAAARTPA